jgi:phosphoribosyl 1,2-cyclic phosphate phosphodiesterase
MKITVLGAGSSAGTPVIGCECPVCHSSNMRNKRSRCSSIITLDNGSNILIDTSPDFKMQAMREKINKIDAVLFTHHHADHCHGIDDLRAYCQKYKQAIPIFANENTMKELKLKFNYAIREETQFWETPVLQANIVNGPFHIEETQIIPLPVIHGRMEILGYRLGNLAYITDVSEIPESTLDLLQGVDILLLDCLRYEPHFSHYGFKQSLEMSEKIKAKRTFFIHMTHDIEYDAVSSDLPDNVYLAYDGLQLNLN